MRAIGRGGAPPDPGNATGPWRGAGAEALGQATERRQDKPARPESLYRRRPGCALLVKRTIMRCNGQVRP